MAVRILKAPSFVLGMLFIIVLAHIIASFGGLYSSGDPSISGVRVDRIFHAVGGFWIASLFFFYCLRKGFIDIHKHPLFAFISAVAMTALIGVWWEVFEFSLDLTFGDSALHIRQQGGVSDTMFDLIFDVIGAGAASAVYVWTMVRAKRSFAL